MNIAVSRPLWRILLLGQTSWCRWILESQLNLEPLDPRCCSTQPTTTSTPFYRAGGFPHSPPQLTADCEFSTTISFPTLFLSSFLPDSRCCSPGASSLTQSKLQPLHYWSLQFTRLLYKKWITLLKLHFKGVRKMQAINASILLEGLWITVLLLCNTEDMTQSYKLMKLIFTCDQRIMKL